MQKQFKNYEQIYDILQEGIGRIDSAILLKVIKDCGIPASDILYNKDKDKDKININNCSREVFLNLEEKLSLIKTLSDRMFIL